MISAFTGDIFCLTLMGLLGIYVPQAIYGDGLTAENLPPATVGDRQASLFVKISPPILTTESQENAFLQFRLFNERDNQTIKFVTYEIAIRKADAPQDSRPLLRDFFHAPNGLLTIKVDPTESGSVQLFGDRDPFQNALVADPGGTVNIRGPILTDGGLYQYEVRIFGIDNIRNIFTPENAPRFDSYLSIGDITYHNLTYDGQDYNSTLISYYDEIDGFDFNPQTKQISWSMPFDWNTTRIQEQNIFVHEEIKLPNAFLEKIGASTSPATFIATVNNQPLTGRALAIDPFTSNDTTIVHYLINKNQILDLGATMTVEGNGSSGGGDGSRSNITDNSNDTAATPASSSGSNNSTTKANSSSQNEIDNINRTTDNTNDSGTTNLMSFTLIPKTENATQSTSSDLTTDTGGIHAAVSWEPRQLRAGVESTVYINFSDAFSGEALNASVIYDMSILDANGTVVLKAENLTAVNSTDSQIITFPADKIYQIEVNVKGVLRGADASPDTTRSGIARGYVVVPEFSTHSAGLFAVGGLLAAVLIGMRWHNSRQRKSHFRR
ncbi:MAG TPA: hypothetical protein VFR94_10140 [Nitrososphaeraceae archaeon]|nr:hypothetical protein [Nitrososphaeraceae archaeon]